MNSKYIMSDLHFGHRNIIKYSGEFRGGTNSEEHDEWLIGQWNSVVKKNDLVYVLGDVAMTEDALKKVRFLKGQKILIRGNHDVYNVKKYLEYFQEVYGLHHFKGTFWMSHAPIHPIELRGRYNLCGHVHQNSIPDERYINCCVEMSYGVPQSLDELLAKYKPIVEAAREKK
jgi:calcineurin-like phosphoesterase family protein